MDLAGDTAFMRRAIRLAKGRLGQTGANPAVGCVVVRRGIVVGEAATAPGGSPHAEEQALASAGRNARGAEVFVTLEPCASRSAGAMSCADRLVEAGVTRVAIACANPHRLSAGAGPQRLRDAGVEVEEGLLAQEAAPLYRDFLAGLA